MLFFSGNWCVTQTLTLDIQEWKKGKEILPNMLLIQLRNFLQWETARGK